MYFENILFSVFFLLGFKLISINSGSTLWRLNSDHSKIVDGTEMHAKVSLFESSISDEEILDIIRSTVFHGETWLKQNNDLTQNYAQKSRGDNDSHVETNSTTKCSLVQANSENKEFLEVKPPIKSSSIEDSLFDCGKPVNFTHYDNLMGVHNRFILPNVSNPQLSSMFGYHTHNEAENEETTMSINFSDYLKFLIRCIKKARQQKYYSAPLYNYLGNYWQLKGYSLKSIECFRKGLSISPHNSRILLNLARLLFSLQYLDDAIYLTKRSLEMEQLQSGVWIHHFTLGEIFKAYGLYQEAKVHLNHSLKLKPNLPVARLILQQINIMHLSYRIHSHTICIIILLVLMVLGIIVMLHNLNIDIPKGRNIIQVSDSNTKYFKHLRRNHKNRKPSA